jgi:hypothetical protein
MTALVMVCPVLLMLLPATAQALQDPMPRTFDEGFPPPADPGVPSGFVAFAVLAVLIGVGTTIWRVSLARQMARDSGMDEDHAASMTLLSDNGLDATYLAANVRGGPRDRQVPEPPSTQSGRTVNERLRELQQLRDDGLVTSEEHETRRRQILDSL